MSICMLTPKLIPLFYFSLKAHVLSLNKSCDLSSSPFVNEISSHDGEVEESSPLCACVRWQLLSVTVGGSARKVRILLTRQEIPCSLFFILQVCEVFSLQVNVINLMTNLVKYK